MADKIHFGPGCSTIEVDPFEPICDMPEPQGSSPSTFHVPLPAAVPPVPPSECICFDFESAEVAPTVVDCKKAPKCKVSISQKDGDCCSGRYVVTPTVEIPCMPFDVATPSVTVKNKSGVATRGTDGNVTFKLEKKCCDLSSTLDVTLPDCVKYHTKPPDVQITYYDKGVARQHKLVTIVEDAANCTFYPEITPLSLPKCTLSDVTLGSGTVNTDGNGSSFYWELKIKDCLPQLSMKATVKPMPVPPNPCFRVVGDNGTYPSTASATSKRRGGAVKALATTQNPFKVRAKYKDSDGDDKYAYGTFTLTEDTIGGCDCFTIGSAEIDLTGIGGSFENGGDVNLRPSDKKLVIDGSEWTGDHTWYGGGYGNVQQDTAATIADVRDRGPGMRNQYTPSGFANISIPSPGALSGNKQQRLLKDDLATTTTQWKSGRYDETTKVFTPGSGNLDICLPSGFEWHMPEITNGPIRGVTVTFSDFVFNSSGVLSEEDETHGAIILAPGLAVTTSKTGSTIVAGKNASGLMTVDDGSVGQTGHGLRVNAGDGLRIYGIGDGSTDSTDTDTDGSRQGCLEVMYGPGFKIKDGTTFLNKPVDRSGALSINVGVGVHVKGQSGAPTLAQRANNQLEVTTVGYELAYSPNGNLIISDFQMPTSDYMGWDGIVDWRRRNETAYGTELVIPILMPASVNDVDLTTSSSFDYYTPSSSVKMKVGYLRIANSGITIGAATKQGWNTYTRLVQAIPT